MLLSFALAADPQVDCASADLNQQQLNACAGQELAHQDALLNEAYPKVMASLDADGKALLKKAERAWIVWRDAECDWDADQYRGGSIAPLEYFSCKATLTKARVATLLERLEER